ncbi:hypothetical protein V2J09_013016 [Rumex salicifolius]
MEIASEMKTRRMTCVVELGKLIKICLVEAFVVEKSSVSNLGSSRKSEKKWWFRKLHSLSYVMGEKQMQIEGSDSLLGKNRPKRVKVRQCSKKPKEMSALYLSQDFQDHEGPILVMKFSPDGEFLASVGEDRIVRMTCVQFKRHCVSLRGIVSNPCVVLPPKVFRLLKIAIENRGEILDLSWLNSNCLLSSSVDKTVRLCQIGYDHCLRVFPHNNYVTCIQFNPIDDNYFISGSLNGKVWIWEISNYHVVTWSDIKGIVTTISYRPDGQGCLVGSITRVFRFYTTSDNQLLLDGQIYLRSKKKSYGKRIIGFQVFIGC